MATSIEAIESLIARLKNAMLKVLRAASTQEESIAVFPQAIQSFLTGPQKVLLWVTEMQQQSTIGQSLRQLVIQLWQSKEHTLPLFIVLDQLVRPLTHLLAESLQHYGLTALEAEQLLATRPPITLIILHYEKLNFKKPKNLYLTNQLERYPIKKMIITCEASYLVPFQGNYALSFMSYRARQAEGKLFMELKIAAPATEQKQVAISEDYWEKLLTEDLAILTLHGIPSLEGFKQHPLNQRRIVGNPGELIQRADSIKDKCTEDSKREGFQFKELLFLFLRFSKRYKEIARGAANAITILKYAGVSFSGMFLQEIRIKGADLSHGIFDSAQLNGADLEDVIMQDAWLRNANLTDAKLWNIQFNEKIFLRIKPGNIFHYSQATHCLITAINNDRFIHLYDLSTNKLIQTFDSGGKKISALAFSLNGQRFVSGDKNGRLCLWSVAKKEPLAVLPECIGEGPEIPEEVMVSQIQFYPRGKYLATKHGFRDKIIQFWDIEQDSFALVSTTPEISFSSMAFNPNELQLALGSPYQGHEGLLFYDFNLKKLSNLLQGSFDHVVFSSDGKKLAVVVDFTMVHLYETKSLKLLGLMQERGGMSSYVSCLAFNKKVTHLAMVINETLLLWDLETLTNPRILGRHSFPILFIDFDIDGNVLSSTGRDGIVRKWIVDKNTFNKPQHSGSIYCMKYDPLRDQIISASGDKTIRSWKKTGQLINTFKVHAYDVQSIALHPEKNWFASGGQEKIVYIWDRTRISPIAEIKVPESNKMNLIIHSLAFHHNGSFIAAGISDGTIHLWDLTVIENIQCIRVYLHGDHVNCVMFHPNGTQLLSAGSAGLQQHYIRLWQLSDGACLRSFKHENFIGTMALHPDGKWLASGCLFSDNKVRLWDLSDIDTNVVNFFEGQSDGSSITAVEFICIHGKDWLIIAGEDQTLCIWDIAQNINLLTIQEVGGVNCLCSWHDKNTLFIVTGGNDSVINCWRIFESEQNLITSSLYWSTHASLVLTGAKVSVNSNLVKDTVELLEERGAVLLKQELPLKKVEDVSHLIDTSYVLEQKREATFVPPRTILADKIISPLFKPSPSYPAVLSCLGVCKHKVTLPKVMNALDKIAQGLTCYDPTIAPKIAAQFCRWSTFHNRNFKLAVIKKLYLGTLNIKSENLEGIKNKQMARF